MLPASKQLTTNELPTTQNENHNNHEKCTDTLRVKVQWVSGGGSVINFLMSLSYKILLGDCFPFFLCHILRSFPLRLLRAVGPVGIIHLMNFYSFPSQSQITFLTLVLFCIFFAAHLSGSCVVAKAFEF